MDYTTDINACHDAKEEFLKKNQSGLEVPRRDSVYLRRLKVQKIETNFAKIYKVKLGSEN